MENIKNNESTTENVVTEKPFYKSATKIVFILMSIGLLAFTFMGIVTGEQFVTIVTSIFAFYFGQKNLKS